MSVVVYRVIDPVLCPEEKWNAEDETGLKRNMTRTLREIDDERDKTEPRKKEKVTAGKCKRENKSRDEGGDICSRAAFFFFEQ
jgi:hypothetical protein